MKSLVTPGQLQREWYVVDAQSEVLGRLATRVAQILQGKHRPYYSPQWDMGDHVIVVNAEKINVTGGKEMKKKYYRHTGYPGGIREIRLADLRKKDPNRIIEQAVRGMLPHNTLAKEMLGKLHVYRGSDHPHQAQQPKPLRTEKDS